ncbi:hypothetical protein WJX82_010731 [Trebouxia sp. C0006]
MDAKIVQAAEQQMRRSAPENPLSKRQKTGTESYQSVARYNYSSQESLQQGAQGFIVTCAFRREKSATKEAVALLSQYLEASPANQLQPGSLPVTVVHQIMDDLQAGTLATPEFCERIIPVQITCSMIQQALTSATQRLAKLHAKQAVEASEDQLVNFAVAYKSRGSSNKAKQAATIAPDSPQQPGPANRQQVITLVAAAVEEAVVSAGGKVHVDLKQPQVVILVEVLPVSAMSLCAISWVPACMTVQTPKLMIKPLVSSQPPAATH